MISLSAGGFDPVGRLYPRDKNEIARTIGLEHGSLAFLDAEPALADCPARIGISRQRASRYSVGALSTSMDMRLRRLYTAAGVTS